MFCNDLVRCLLVRVPHAIRCTLELRARTRRRVCGAAHLNCGKVRCLVPVVPGHGGWAVRCVVPVAAPACAGAPGRGSGDCHRPLLACGAARVRRSAVLERVTTASYWVRTMVTLSGQGCRCGCAAGVLRGVPGRGSGEGYHRLLLGKDYGNPVRTGCCCKRAARVRRGAVAERVTTASYWVRTMVTLSGQGAAAGVRRGVPGRGSGEGYRRLLLGKDYGNPVRTGCRWGAVQRRRGAVPDRVTAPC